MEVKIHQIMHTFSPSKVLYDNDSTIIIMCFLDNVCSISII